ncbi:MAG TPA: UvrB/UvrC motif-containing protein [Candidatus Paceibacterota bacterium]
MINEDKIANFPESPGVYLFKGVKGQVLYVGKAGNLKRRVSSYFRRAHPTSPRLRGASDSKIERLLAETRKIGFIKSDTAIEALILEAELIKKFVPLYNTREKDDKSFLYVVITQEDFPRVLLSRGKVLPAVVLAKWGPFTSASNIRAALKILRRIFPFSVHDPKRVGKFTRPCFDAQIGLCPGTCIGATGKTEYRKNIKNIRFFFQGKKERILRSLEREMKEASKKLQFEKAESLRHKIFALQHIQDIALISEGEVENWKLKIENSAKRLEAYDISNISGTSAVGSMVVFHGSKPVKEEYRLFRIRTVRQTDDVGMLKEVLRRRFKHEEWPYPEVILVDGGKPQVNAAKMVLGEFGLRLPIVGLAKGPKRRKNDIIGAIHKGVSQETLKRLRDEAHRFAITYHRKLRSKTIYS